MYLIMSPAKWRSFPPVGDELTLTPRQYQRPVLLAFVREVADGFLSERANVVETVSMS